MLSDQVVMRFVAQKRDQRGIGAEQNSGGIAAANAVWSIGDQRAEVDFGAPQSLLG